MLELCDAPASLFDQAASPAPEAPPAPAKPAAPPTPEPVRAPPPKPLPSPMREPSEIPQPDRSPLPRPLRPVCEVACAVEEGTQFHEFGSTMIIEIDAEIDTLQFPDIEALIASAEEG